MHIALYLTHILAATALFLLCVSLLVRMRWRLLAGLLFLLMWIGAAGLYAAAAIPMWLFWSRQGMAVGDLVAASMIVGGGVLLGSLTMAIVAVTRRRGAAQLRGAEWSLGWIAASALGLLVLHAGVVAWASRSVGQEMRQLRGAMSRQALAVAPVPIPDAHNAALLYALAARGLPDRQPEDVIDATSSHPQTYRQVDWGVVKQYVEEHRESLELASAGSRRPGWYLPKNYGDPGFDRDVSEMAGHRQLAEVLGARAVWRARQGRSDAALEDIASLYRLRAHVEWDPYLLSLLISFAIDAQADAALERVLAVSEPSADRLAALRALKANRVDPRALTQRSLLMEEAIVRSTVANVALGGLVLNKVPEAVNLLLYRLFMAERDAAGLGEYLRSTIELYDAPFPELYRATLRFEEAEDQRIAESGGVLVGILAPGFARHGKMVVRVEARNRLVETALAAAEFCAREGRLPESIEALVPRYLPEVPLDPFDSEVIRMRQAEGSLIVYSVGPNGIDDGGVEESWHHPDGVRTSSGDLVFVLGDREAALAPIGEEDAPPR